MLVHSYISLVLLSVSAHSILADPTICSQQKKIKWNVEWFQKVNYLTVMRSSWKIFQCAKVVVFDAKVIDSTYSASAIVFRPNTKIDFNLILSEDGSTWNATICSIGFTSLFYTAFANFTGNNTAYCVYNCNGVTYGNVVCFGVTDGDKQLIDRFLTENAIPGVTEHRNLVPDILLKKRISETFTVEMYLKVFFVLLAALIDKGQLITTPCNKLPKPYIDEKMLIDNSPMYIYYTSWNIFKCGSLSWVRPQTGETGYNITGLLSAGGVATSIRLILTNNNLWDATLCSTGFRDLYPTVLTNFNGTNRLFCVVQCGPDGASYLNTICWGKTNSDKELIKEFLQKNEIPLYFDAQSGCDLTDKVCKATNNLVKSIGGILPFVFAGLVGTSQLLTTPCNKLPKPYIDEQMLIDNNPMDVYYTSWNMFKCGSMSWVPPQTGQTGYNLTGLLSVGSVAISLRLILTNNNAWDGTVCSTGFRAICPTVLANFTGTNRHLCVVNCGTDGASYINTVCWGKTNRDKELIQEFLQQNEIPRWFDAQVGCDVTDKICKASNELLKPIVFAALVGTSQLLTTPCSKLPTPYIDEQMLIENNPMYIYYTSWNLFKCGTMSWVPPQTGETGFNLTALLSVGSIATSFRLILKKNNVWDSTVCSTGLRANYPTVLWNFNGTNRHLCVVSCGLDGASYINTICWGKTNSDKELIKQFLQQNEIPRWVDAQIGCDLTDKVCKATNALLESVVSIIPSGK
ncbi:hypothetical protein CHUAL_005115 [Chamberlinius hualienensis]